MKKQDNIGRFRLGAVIAAVSALAITGNASAALLTCPDAFSASGTAKVHDGSAAKNSAASACQYLDPPDQNMVANETNVNTAVFFGFSDWMATAVRQIDAGSARGTWAIPSPDFAARDYMITFKSGQGTNLISFLLNEIAASGGWDTPFVEPVFNLAGGATARDVSHLSIFMRPAAAQTSTELTPLPEPTSIALLGLGLSGLAWLRRRRRTG